MNRVGRPSLDEQASRATSSRRIADRRDCRARLKALPPDETKQMIQGSKADVPLVAPGSVCDSFGLVLALDDPRPFFCATA